ncbi:MAG: DUF4174 domain-containing protein [Alphaproteobacteria bacterium]|nr:DUF4174 domain-containing protein [Alphaproteobacteria bacterium]
MRRTLAGLALIGAALAPGAASADLLAAYRWENRLLVVLADGPSDPKLIEQRAILADDPNGLQERDLIVLEGVGNAPVALPGGPVAPQTLRDALGVKATGFAALLIGKDGGVKLRQNAPVVLDATLYPLIDAMPMRRREMQERGE